MRLAHLLISTESPLRAVGACVICAPTVAIQASQAQPQRMHGDVFPQRYIREPQICLRSAAGILGEMSAYRRLPKSKWLRRDFFFQDPLQFLTEIASGVGKVVKSEQKKGLKSGSIKVAPDTSCPGGNPACGYLRLFIVRKKPQTGSSFKEKGTWG